MIVDDIARVVQVALEEDLNGGVDVTSVATIAADERGVAHLVTRAAGVIAGLPVAERVFAITCNGDVRVDAGVEDGTAVARDAVVMTVEGPVRGLLSGERTALNLLCHLSGVATLTRRFVEAVSGTSARILDTRKTTPGLRALEKYAVRCGGGENKRMGLYDAALVKDNHVVAAGGVPEAFQAVRTNFPDVDVQVECDTVGQVQAALDAGATFLLCDNMTLDELRAAVSSARGRARIEATGGVTLDTAAAIAGTGVDYISVGALTHSAPALDIGMDLVTVSAVRGGS